MSFADDLIAEPWRFDFLAVMRRCERSFPDRPRIGESGTRRDEYVALGEHPYLDFPASSLSGAEYDAQGRLRIFVKFLGLLGPQGPLPLATTEEAYSWWLARDDAFARFLDLLNNRFLQLFFRAWADARPIAHHDRPHDDRFADYVGTAIGIGTPPFRQLDAVSDMGKLAYAGLLAPQAKSAGRLRNFISGLFGVETEVEQFVGSWLALEPDDRTTLGGAQSTLGSDVLLGRSTYSVQDKIRIHIRMRDLDQYQRFLPTGDLCTPLTDAVFFYLGAELDWDVQLAIPAGRVAPVRLGRSGNLGWTSWMSPTWAATDQTIRADARLNLAERLQKRRTGTRDHPRPGDERWPTSASKP